MVATVLTVYGIETGSLHQCQCVHYCSCNSTYRLRYWNYRVPCIILVRRFGVATVLTVYGIETIKKDIYINDFTVIVATVLTVYGIETRAPPLICHCTALSCNSTYRLRYWNYFFASYLKSMVLISCNSTYRLRYWNAYHEPKHSKSNRVLQQYLPFTVLKLRNLQ